MRHFLQNTYCPNPGLVGLTPALFMMCLVCAAVGAFNGNDNRRSNDRGPDTMDEV